MQRIKEIIELIEITGDKCIILHKEEQAYVVMKLDDYKRFYQEQLGNREENRKESTKAMENNQKTVNIRPIPHLPANIKEFEIRQKAIDFEEDIYYPEPLIE